jgi:hypothetical protein
MPLSRLVMRFALVKALRANEFYFIAALAASQAA